MIDEPKQEDAAPIRTLADPDWFLASLISVVNQSGSKLGVTLTIGGSVVSGNLCSGKAYFDAVGVTLGKAWGDNPGENSVQESIASYGGIYSPPSDGSDKKAPPPTFIHLENAQVWAPGIATPIPSNGGVWWRGRLSEVAGWSLGVLSRNDE